MQIDDAIEMWLNWASTQRRPNENILSRLMRNVSPKPCYASTIPYGLDLDGVCMAIDRAVCAMPPIRRQVLVLEYACFDTQENKARMCNPPICRRNFQKQLYLAQAQIVALPAVKKLFDDVAY